MRAFFIDKIAGLLLLEKWGVGNEWVFDADCFLFIDVDGMVQGVSRYVLGCFGGLTDGNERMARTRQKLGLVIMRTLD